MECAIGDPITDETLQEMKEYKGKSITLKERARVALKMKSSRQVQLRKLVEKLKEQAGGVGGTVCLIYNATGDDLNLITSRDWSGQFGFAPYPPIIENGQWGFFFHEKEGNSSIGAVVYRGKTAAGEERDWMQAWRNQKPNKAYCEIREAWHWNNNKTPWNISYTWGIVRDKLNDSRCSNVETQGGATSTVIIGNDSTCPIFEATLRHPS